MASGAMRIEANALSDPLACSFSEVFLLLRKPFFEPSSPNANAEGEFRSAVYKTRGSPPSLPSLPSLGEELFSLWRNAAEGSIEK